MGYGEEYYADFAYEIEYQKNFYSDVNENRDELSEKTDNEVLQIALNCGSTGTIDISLDAIKKLTKKA